MKEVKFPFYARLAFVLLTITLIIHLLVLGQDIFVPLFFSLLISFLLYPLSRKLELRFGMSKGLATLLAMTAFIAAIALIVYFITFQVLAFSQDLPLLQKNITRWISHTQDWIVKEYQVDSSDQLNYLEQATNGIINYTANSLGAIFIRISEFLFWSVLVIIYTYFIIYNRRMLLRFILRLFRDEHRDKVEHVILETRLMTNNYLRGLFIEFLIVAIANTLMLYIVGVHYFLLLGIIAALLNFIPYLGIIIGCLLTLLVTLAYSTPMVAMEATALLFFLHILDANLLLPRLIGLKMKINSLVTIISVLAGGILWGVAGMFLAIPLCAMLKIIFDHVTELAPWGMLMGTSDKTKSG